MSLLSNEGSLGVVLLRASRELRRLMRELDEVSLSLDPVEAADLRLRLIGLHHRCNALTRAAGH